jgi:uncharacterized membrane protein
MRRSAYLPGRPYLREDGRLWVGLLLGTGIGAAAAALADPERRAMVRMRLANGASRLRALSARSSHREDGTTVGRSASTIEDSIEIDVPVERAYDEWTHFEDFPKFMEGVASVRRDPVDDQCLHWEAEVAGTQRAWDARITEQSENQRVAWCSTDGTRNAGVVTFHRLSPERCKVMLQMEYEPEGPLDAVGDSMGLLRRRVRGDLDRFRAHLENAAGVA